MYIFIVHKRFEYHFFYEIIYSARVAGGAGGFLGLSVWLVSYLVAKCKEKREGENGRSWVNRNLNVTELVKTVRAMPEQHLAIRLYWPVAAMLQGPR